MEAWKDAKFLNRASPPWLRACCSQGFDKWSCHLQRSNCLPQHMHKWRGGLLRRISNCSAHCKFTVCCCCLLVTFMTQPNAPAFYTFKADKTLHKACTTFISFIDVLPLYSLNSSCQLVLISPVSPHPLGSFPLLLHCCGWGGRVHEVYPYTHQGMQLLP